MPLLPLRTIALPDATNRVFDAWLDELGPGSPSPAPTGRA